jgi:hypothetical protein
MSVHTRWMAVGASALAVGLTVGLAPAARADVDVRTPYEAQVSCDPRPKPGVARFAALMRAKYDPTGYIGTYRPCAGDTSEHYDSRAMDWMLNVKNPAQNRIAYRVTRWMSANGGANARRFGISYMIYNHLTWKVYRSERGWYPYTGAVPHTDHVHFSFSWDGAMARTSAFSGRVNRVIDLGPCQVYAGQFAPLRTGIRTAPCPTRLAKAPVSIYRVAVYGQRSAQIKVAQKLLGATADGSFGPATFSKVAAWQRGRVPITGALDKATWRRLTGK